MSRAEATRTPERRELSRAILTGMRDAPAFKEKHASGCARGRRAMVWFPEMDQTLREMRAADANRQQIADKIGVAVDTMEKRMDVLGIPRCRRGKRAKPAGLIAPKKVSTHPGVARVWTPAMDEQLRTLRGLGYCQTQAALSMGCGIHSFVRRLDFLGLPRVLRSV